MITKLFLMGIPYTAKTAIHEEVECYWLSPTDLEIITIELNSTHSSKILCLVYNPPNESTESHEHLIAYLKSLSTHNHLLIIGDFNMPDINWATLTGATQSSSLFCVFMFEHSLSQLVTDPTHVKGNTLDLIITNNKTLISDISIEAPSSQLASDHYCLSFSICTSPNKATETPRVYIWDYAKADFNCLCSHLECTNFDLALASHSVETIWSIIKTAISDAMTISVPRLRLRSHQRPKWFTSVISHKLNQVHTARKKHKSKPSVHSETSLITKELELQSDMKEAKANYENTLIHTHANTNHSKIYKYINSITSSNSLPPIMDIDNLTADTDVDKASLFNSFFHSVFTISSFTLPDPLPVAHPSEHLSGIHFTQEDVYTALTNLNPNKGVGVDEIGPKILKQCASVLFIPIHHLFTQ